MSSPEETAIKLTNYFKKLQRILNNEAIFSLGKKKLYNKNRIDDILCCIEATFPKGYTDYIKKTGGKDLKSYEYYQKLMYSIKNKFMFSSSHYFVNYREANTFLLSVIKTITGDVKNTCENSQNMY